MFSGYKIRLRKKQNPILKIAIFSFLSAVISSVATIFLSPKDGKTMRKNTKKSIKYIYEKAKTKFEKSKEETLKKINKLGSKPTRPSEKVKKTKESKTIK